MADWTVIADSALDPDAPITSDLAYAWRDNPIAIAEGATGAPKIATPATYGSGITVTFTDLDAFSGLVFDLTAAVKASGGNTNVTLSYSANNGSSWSSEFNLVSLIGSSAPHSMARGTFDFDSGLFAWVGSAGGNSDIGSGTATGSSLSVNAVRFSSSGVLTLGVIIYPNGGII